MQYGYHAQFCADVLSDTPLSGVAKGTRNLAGMIGVQPIQLTFESIESMSNPGPTDDISGLLWLYQSCTQFGGFSVAYHDPALSAQSSLLDLNHTFQFCQKLFGLTKLPDTDQTNQTFYQPLFDSSTSHIVYVNGSQDPYSTLSISDVNGNNTNPRTESVVIAGGSHCIDLMTFFEDSALAKAVSDFQSHFLEVAKGWLGSKSN